MRRRQQLLAGILIGMCILTACGKKETEVGNTPENGAELESVTLTAAEDFRFLELIGKDCQLLPADVEAEVSETVVVATGKEQERVGGVGGTVTYRYEVENPFITEIDWTAINLSDAETTQLDEAMTDRYGEPDIRQENRLEDDDSISRVAIWKGKDGCQIRETIEENPINGANATIVWREVKEDDFTFLEYLGQEVSTLPADKTLDLSEGTAGLKILMDEVYIYGVGGSISYYFTVGENNIHAVSWESQEMTQQGVEELLGAIEAQYGFAEQREETASGESQIVYGWTDADGHTVEMMDLAYGEEHFVSIRWE